MQNLAIVFLGAGIGGAFRHGVNVATLRLFGSSYPWGTFTVNLLGSLLMGLVAGWFAHKADPGQHWRLFLTTGILGGFTTFSAFSLDAALMWERGDLATALGYILSSVVLGVLGLFAGLFLIRHLV